MGIIFANKETDKKSVEPNGKFKIKITLTAAPNGILQSTDALFLLDRSCSTEDILQDIKSCALCVAEGFMSRNEEKPDSGCRAAVMGFSDSTELFADFTGSANDVNNAINSISSDNYYSDHSTAFKDAIDLLKASKAENKKAVIFTDGLSADAADATVYAQIAKNLGIEIYCIGLPSACGINAGELYEWSSSPKSEHLFISPDCVSVKSVLCANSDGKSDGGANGIVINEKVSPCFEINSVTSTTHGKAVITDENSLIWQIESLGNYRKETAELIFEVEHTGCCTGNVTVNKSIFYCDRECHQVTFPSPTVNICPSPCPEPVIYPEICPKPINIAVDGCEDAVNIDVGEFGIESLGRILQLNVKLKNVCPDKRVALAVILNELDACGMEHKRGLKVLEVPAHKKNCCVDVNVNCIKFVLPESLDPSGNTDSICNGRKFTVRCVAHYIDNDLICCE